jgi:hypothetical protein
MSFVLKPLIGPPRIGPGTAKRKMPWIRHNLSFGESEVRISENQPATADHYGLVGRRILLAGLWGSPREVR